MLGAAGLDISGLAGPFPRIGACMENCSNKMALFLLPRAAGIIESVPETRYSYGFPSTGA
ncbi:hypothetical protein A6M21_17560 [Desulfotomaculum copahuensis]|uniref:Uncharacterized protein n=1 Tax=Desulfotomaculum copahuensis TaxID=1838280 RepID=A0A1B7LFK7_9FIRM|nr:hypothetical protein A6M21_17560 [Desulfotomaculum copahuensis]